jgi:hypothetical protein
MLLEIGEMFSSWHIFRNPWWRRQRYQKVRLPGSLKGLQASHFPVTGGLWLLAGGLLLAAFTAVR